ncbi:MAG TPA: hypothetical protein VHV55_15575 [Pirellulales bacterium]|jgi:hypothetical protein|nr:hypothetical protein [Pirellulales bacterium]
MAFRVRFSTGVLVRSYRDRRFVGWVLLSDQESWIGTVRDGSTGVMTAWSEFVRDQARLHL